MLMMPTGGTDIQAERSGESIGAAEAACPGPDQGLRCAFENVSVFLKAPQVSLEQVKRSLSIPRIGARSPQTDYEAFLLLYDASPFGDEFLGAAKIVFGIHLIKITRKGENRRRRLEISRVLFGGKRASPTDRGQYRQATRVSAKVISVIGATTAQTKDARVAVKAPKLSLQAAGSLSRACPAV
jgi:hypothetical protein